MADPSIEQAMADRLERRPWPAIPLRGDVEVSFELFPPNGPKGTRALAKAASRLATLAPAFISVTYGAGGSTQDRTLSTLGDLASDVEVPLAGHLTCVGATEATVHGVLDRYADLGLNRVVALRGDAPSDGSMAESDFEDAAALVSAIRARRDGGSWDISVAGYPEVHPKASSPASDLEQLKRKVDAGADRVLTQFFFDNEAFLRLRDAAKRAGVEVPMVPGIMPVGNFERISSFAGRCGTRIPEWMPQLFGELEDVPETRQLVAATVAAEQCRHLREHGVGQFHFYTMNTASLTEATCRMLGIIPETSDAAMAEVS